jgi:mannose-6-phosphate isomerase-like protein (cupin superfamily)
VRKESAKATEMEEFILEAGNCTFIPLRLVYQIEALEDAESYELLEPTLRQ